jgi:hypothetical protein
VAGGLLRCGICGRKMQGSWNNGKPQYRCVFLSEYAAKNKVGSRGLSVFEVAGTDFHARLHSYPGATRCAPGSELCTVVAIAQGMDHPL